MTAPLRDPKPPAPDPGRGGARRVDTCKCGSLLGRPPAGAERTRTGWVRRGPKVEHPRRARRLVAYRPVLSRPLTLDGARPGGPTVIAGWEVRLFVSSGLVRRCRGEITVHHSEEDARLRAEGGLERLRAQWRAAGPDTCFVATVERAGERLTCYLLPEGPLDWDAVRDRR